MTFCAGIAAQLRDCVAEFHLLGGFAVDLEDLVARQQPGLEAGRVLHRGDDDEIAILRRNDDAEAAELALGIVLHPLEVIRVHELAVRVQRAQHAPHRAVGEVVEGDFFLIHVILADELEGAGEDGDRRVAGVIPRLLLVRRLDLLAACWRRIRRADNSGQRQKQRYSQTPKFP